MRQPPATDNIIDLTRFREATQREVIDDISARAFLFLQEEAEQEALPMKMVLAEHLLGITLVVEAVEGSDAARKLLDAVAQRLGASAV